MISGLPTILVSFLHDPFDRRAFHLVFQITHRELISYLRQLSQRGYRLPIDCTDTKNALGNLAYDILGTFFASEADRPFPVIFGFFVRHGITDFQSIAPVRLAELYMWLLRGYTLKEIGYIAADGDPQLARLKRRFYEALENQSMALLREVERERYWCLPPAPAAKPAPPTAMPSTQLAQIVELAFLNSNTVESWNRNVLQLVSEQSNYPSVIREVDLIAAVTAVHVRYMVEEAPMPSPEMSQMQFVAREQFEIELTATLQWFRDDLLAEWVGKRKLTELEASRYAEAAELYLRDSTNGGIMHPASYGSYFRQVHPAEIGALYVEKYKTLFESLIKKAEDHFAERIRNNPTIRKIWSYW